MTTTPPESWSDSDRNAIREQLDRIVNSGLFVHSRRRQRFLELTVTEALAGRGDQLKGYSIGLEVFERPETFDPVVDPLVRIEAARLREKLHKSSARETANSLPIGFRPSLRQCAVKAQIIICLALGALAVALFTAAGSAQTGHGKYHDGFYSRWLTKQGYSCCSNKDCRRISADHVRVLSDKMQVLLDGEWVDVRPDAIRPYAAPDMSSHICASGKYIFCFVYGSGV